MKNAAEGVKAAGVKIMRGGAFKPRTSPYSFQGTGFEGLEMFREAADIWRNGNPMDNVFEAGCVDCFTNIETMWEET